MLLRLNSIVLLSLCLLTIGVVLVLELLISDPTTLQHKLQNSSYKISSYTQSAPFTSKAADMESLTNTPQHKLHNRSYKISSDAQSALFASKAADMELPTNTPQQYKNSSYSSSGTPQPTTFSSKAPYKELYDQLVILTAFSDNHFEEAKDMIASVQTCLPDKKIIVYDLGLNPSHKKQVLKYCNVELRSFPFKKYRQPHVKNLHTYAWKPIITRLVSTEYHVIMYGDASLRMKSCNIRRALAYLFTFPFLCLNPIHFRAIEFSHDGMIEYLHYPKDRKDMAQVITLEASSFLMWANPLMKRKLIKPWLDCGLHQRCIAPKGSRLHPCHFAQVHDGHYVGCHRYDQSALNLILAREFGVDGMLKAVKRQITGPVWNVTKQITNEYSLSYCT